MEAGVICLQAVAVAVQMEAIRHPNSEAPGRRSSIIVLLLVAFLIVSVLPVGTLAFLSLTEGQESAEQASARSSSLTSEVSRH